MKNKAFFSILFFFFLCQCPMWAKTQNRIMKRNELLKNAIFKSNHFSFQLAKLNVTKSHASATSGYSSFKTSSSGGLLAGLNFSKHINNDYSLSLGLDGWLSGRNFKVIYKKQDFNPALDADLKAKTATSDLITGITLQIERRIIYHHYKFLSFASGIRLNYSTGADMDITSIFIPASQSSQLYEAAKVTVTANNDARPWLSFPLLVGHNWLLKNNNLFSLDMIGNVSFSKYVKGTFLINTNNTPATTGTYSNNGSFWGILFKYTFTNTNNYLRKKIEKRLDP
jgi:hypothetical protein